VRGIFHQKALQRKLYVGNIFFIRGIHLDVYATAQEVVKGHYDTFLVLLHDGFGEFFSRVLVNTSGPPLCSLLEVYMGRVNDCPLTGDFFASSCFFSCGMLASRRGEPEAVEAIDQVG